MKIVRAPRSAVCKNLFCFALSSLSFVFCLSVQAQQPKMISLGFLGATSAAIEKDRIDVFMEGMRELGYVENKNIVIKWRFAEGKFTRLPELANELVRLKVDVIVTTGPTSTRAAKEATTVIPIVMGFDNDPVGSNVGDPVAQGFVASLARPGGNITGFTNLSPDVSTKRLELLKEAAPKISRVAVFSNAAQHAPAIKNLETAAQSLRLHLLRLEVRNANDLNKAFEMISRERAHALLTMPNPLLRLDHTARLRIVNFTVEHRMPSVHEGKEYVEGGCLMAYGSDESGNYRRAALYVDKILKGNKPADLPVEQPTKFEFVINLKTAKQIGLTIPPNVLVRADKVIR
jgi:putative tryptophan/tyrosine transport system substrate-binding protein